MLRLLGFFVLVVLLRGLLVHLPIVGPFFAASGIFGLWITAALLSFVLTRFGERAVRVQRDQRQVQSLLAVDTPHARGKVGSLYLAQGRPRRALEHLERAVEGEPDVSEWSYRLGLAHLRLGQREEAIRALRRALELDPDRGYGAARLALAEALRRDGRAGEALAELERLEREHGPSPESAFRRGQALRALGRPEEARAAFAEVGRLAREGARYQRGTAAGWEARAALARLR